MKKTKNGFSCRKCGYLIRANTGLQTEEMKMEHTDSIHIADSSEDEYMKASQTCPKCGNPEAFRWYSGVSGEHAGVRRERTVEHFKCTRCSHSWSKTS